MSEVKQEQGNLSINSENLFQLLRNGCIQTMIYFSES